MTDQCVETIHVLERMRIGVEQGLHTLAMGHYNHRPGVGEAQAGTMATQRDALAAAIASLREQAERDQYYDGLAVAHGYAG